MTAILRYELVGGDLHDLLIENTRGDGAYRVQIDTRPPPSTLCLCDAGLRLKPCKHVRAALQHVADQTGASP